MDVCALITSQESSWLLFWQPASLPRSDANRAAEEYSEPFFGGGSGSNARARMSCWRCSDTILSHPYPHTYSFTFYQQVVPTTVKIGGLVTSSSDSDETKTGMQLAIKKINEDGVLFPSDTVELMVLDDAGTAWNGMQVRIC